MTPIRLTYLLLILTVTYGCNRHWVRTESSDQIVWNKISLKKDTNSFDKLSDNCSLVSRTYSQKGKLDNYYFYEFDTIRIYVQQTDDLLNKMVEKGFIQGQFFFTPIIPNNCQPRHWSNPLKSDHNNWFGYNLFLTGLREIKTTKFPKTIKRKIDSYKVFKVSFSYIGQPFINPEVFRFELTNPKYKSNQDSVSFDTFLEKALTTNFYQDGFEI